MAVYHGSGLHCALYNMIKTFQNSSVLIKILYKILLNLFKTL